MKKNSMMKTNKKNLEARFDSGSDVLDYFDTEKVRVWGGARKGAGRKKSGRTQYVTRLSPALIRTIKARARKQGVSECEVVEAALASSLR